MATNEDSANTKTKTRNGTAVRQVKPNNQQSTLQIYARLRVIMPWESDTL